MKNIIKKTGVGAGIILIVGLLWLVGYGLSNCHKVDGEHIPVCRLKG